MTPQRFFNVIFVIVALVGCAVAQGAPNERFCTDLSGKVRLACPHEMPVQAQSSADASDANGASPGDAESPARKVSAVQSLSRMAVSSAKDGGSTSPVAMPVARRGALYRSLEWSLPRNFVDDQKNILLGPRMLRLNDTHWLVPLVGAMAAVTLSDGSIERKLPTSASLITRSKSFSDYGAAAYAAAVGGSYLFSLASHNDHLRETAVLSGEAALNSLLITEGLKYIAGRQRPFEGDGTGSFRRGGSSFPSLHSAGAWSIASVIASEYPGPLSQMLAYGGAAAISAARVTSRQHFASDVAVGAAIGWFAGRQVYNAHHGRDSADAQYGTFQRASGDRGPANPDSMGSTYVPLDSWVYPALERLAALGYIDSAFTDLRPWTRLECAQLVEQSDSKFRDGDVNAPQADQLRTALSREFARELRLLNGEDNLGAEIESVYTRVTGISGTPLTDGFHFGQTFANDYGRPYQEGFNSITGISGRADAGPLAVYVRGEYQRSPSAAAPGPSISQLIASVDGLPPVTGSPISSINRFRLLDAYVAFAASGFQVSFGKQSSWWGPGIGGDLLLSNNAEPMYMLRISRTTPLRLPSIFDWLGPIRTEGFLGQLQGHHYARLGPGFVLVGSSATTLDPQPFIYGQKFTMKPTPNLELGVSITTVFAGQGRPLTFDTFLHTLSFRGNNQAVDPGDRRTGFDFRYKVPGLRDWLVLYNGSMSEDEPNPVAYPRRSAMNPGIYMPRLPGIPRLDLRVEGVYTDLPGLINTGYFYSNTHYADGYRNYGQTMGSWVGREGRGWQLWSTYWLGPENKIGFAYRKGEVAKDFIPGGGDLRDYSVRADWNLRSGLAATFFVQAEQWYFPSLSVHSVGNVAASFQLTYRPKLRLGH